MWKLVDKGMLHIIGSLRVAYTGFDRVAPGVFAGFGGFKAWGLEDFLLAKPPRFSWVGF